MISFESVNAGREIDTMSKDIDLSLNIVVRNVLESCTDSMNSLHYSIPSSMLPRIIER